MPLHRNAIERNCLFCGTSFSPRLNEVKKGQGRFCSPSCYYQHTKDQYVVRFWSKVQKSDGCWEWTGTLHGNGYGQATRFGRHVYPHRLSYELHYGAIPDQMMVCHACDNRLCVRPDHLFLGSHNDNMVDMARKRRAGRHSSPASYGKNVRPPIKRGENANGVKLTEADVRAIRQRAGNGVMFKAIANEFGVTPENVSQIVHRKTWKHVA